MQLKVDLDEVKEQMKNEQGRCKSLQDALLSGVESVLDDELTCAICQEFFIKVEKNMLALCLPEFLIKSMIIKYDNNNKQNSRLFLQDFS